MGNSHSNDVSHASAPMSYERPSLSHAPPKRKAHGKPPPNPAATLFSASGTASTSTTSTHATATTLSASPKRSHARARSITTATPPHAGLDPASIFSISRTQLSAAAAAAADNNSTTTMGQGDSKPAAPSRASTLPIPTSTPPRKATATPDPEQPSEPPPDSKPSSASPSTRPVAVPPPPSDTDGPADKDDYIPTGHLDPASYTLPASNYSRPPRLPLPIEEEVHTPGSPIINPQDAAAGVKDVETSVLDQADVEGGAIPRKTSVLSSTTMDEDEIGDNEAFANEAQWGEIRVPTTLEWHGPGDKIFVTGTFCNWEKKVKLHRNKDKSGFSATVNLRPGTHHIKFLVDGEMITSNELPTTVDWTNILVNYIEIVAPLPPAPQAQKQAPAPAVPMPIPGAAITAGQAAGTVELAARPISQDMQTRVPETEADLAISPHEAVGPKGELPDSIAGQTPVPGPSASQEPQSKPEPKPTPAPPKQKLPRPKYTNQIPGFLIDLDNYNNPDDERYRRAQRVAEYLPQPPSLPMFLSKSILNGATPHKDDASVLVMPNHTVLNHLATSSIKGGVLATSGTTRYKRKFLTTIMYKPTSDD
ncbi:carbohydrate-binding module family 48 [Lecanosticta acicola]|uniref:Carbohydrate-binding module family 48 n=1 Tax=Lecanosticta acicola TaxID=111012 RepID=A0AAI8YSX5_9PEZI|nr:carbohydrate-binding module family 48 [Lecanosticta acicola]